MKVECPISLGELVDKISILRIKMVKIKDNNKVAHVSKEEKLLSGILQKLNLKNIDSYEEKLREINSKLWDIEDEIRVEEQKGGFSTNFIRLARAVYITNDLRFAIKSEINQKFSSDIEEVKSYSSIS